MKRIEWPRDEIDVFVLARLEAAGISPSPEADRATLVRRVTLDLTGLPPTPEEVDAFLADRSPDALERLVDRLLASVHYGEHRARDWLDAARYADTHGYFTDHERFMWRWRDWVIEAFNQNMPFDQFTIEQLAGDLLPEPTVAQRIATGFNRNHMVTEETGVIPEEYRVGIRGRPRAHDGRRVDGADGRLRAVPRPQVRPADRSASTISSLRTSTACRRRESAAARRTPRRCSTWRRSEEAKRRTELRKAVAALDAKLKPPAADADDPEIAAAQASAEPTRRSQAAGGRAGCPGGRGAAAAVADDGDGDAGAGRAARDVCARFAVNTISWASAWSRACRRFCRRSMPKRRRTGWDLPSGWSIRGIR